MKMVSWIPLQRAVNPVPSPVVQCAVCSVTPNCSCRHAGPGATVGAPHCVPRRIASFSRPNPSSKRTPEARPHRDLDSSLGNPMPRSKSILNLAPKPGPDLHPEPAQARGKGARRGYAGPRAHPGLRAPVPEPPESTCGVWVCAWQSLLRGPLGVRRAAPLCEEGTRMTLWPDSCEYFEGSLEPKLSLASGAEIFGRGWGARLKSGAWCMGHDGRHPPESLWHPQQRFMSQRDEAATHVVQPGQHGAVTDCMRCPYGRCRRPHRFGFRSEPGLLAPSALPLITLPLLLLGQSGGGGV